MGRQRHRVGIAATGSSPGRSSPSASRSRSSGGSRRLPGPIPPWGLRHRARRRASDGAAIATHVRRVDGGYVLNGSKTWISNAPEADRYLVRDGRARPLASKGITTFVMHKRRRWIHPRQEDPEARHPAPPERRALPHGLLPAGGPAHRRRGAGVPGRAGVVRSLARAARGGLVRRRARRARARDRLREGARGVREADPRVPGGLVPAGRREAQARPGEAADPSRRTARRCPGGLHDRVGDGQGRGERGRVVRGVGGRADVRRLRLLARVPRGSCCAMPSSTRSGRARATSSA